MNVQCQTVSQCEYIVHVGAKGLVTLFCTTVVTDQLIVIVGLMVQLLKVALARKILFH